MFRTLIGLFKIIWYLISSLPTKKKVDKLDKEGKIKERDEVVAPLVMSWAQYMIKVTGKNTTVKVIGEENVPQDTAVVFIGNHQGYFDIPLLLGYINKPKAFVSKIEVLKVPIISDWMRYMQCTFLDRKNPRQSIKAMSEAVENVRKGYSLVIFPEGTRSKGGPIKEFKAGSFKLAFKSGVPIVPVTIDGTWKLFEEKKRLQPAEITLTIHPAIPTAGLSKEELTLIPPKVQEIVARGLKGWIFRKKHNSFG